MQYSACRTPARVTPRTTTPARWSSPPCLMNRRKTLTRLCLPIFHTVTLRSYGSHSIPRMAGLETFSAMTGGGLKTLVPTTVMAVLCGHWAQCSVDHATPDCEGRLAVCLKPRFPLLSPLPVHVHGPLASWVCRHILTGFQATAPLRAFAMRWRIVCLISMSGLTPRPGAG